MKKATDVNASVAFFYASRCKMLGRRCCQYIIAKIFFRVLFMPFCVVSLSCLVVFLTFFPNMLVHTVLLS